VLFRSESAQKAYGQFELLAAKGPSLGMLAESLVVRNLLVVSAQDELPAFHVKLPRIIEKVENYTEGLHASAEEAATILELCRCLLPDAIEGEFPPDDATERALWTALTDGEPAWNKDDIELGRCFGTVARSLGFLGRFEEALGSAMKARSRFRRSPFDRRFNGVVIANLQLEAARMGDSSFSVDRLRAASDASHASAFVNPATARQEAERNKGWRFQIDVVLRSMLWAPESPWLGDWTARWMEALEARGASSLFEFLATACRSHPTELIARHAGELMQGAGASAAAQSWFDLGIEVAREGGPGLQRLAKLTERLRSGQHAAEGPLGSLFNPNFEYR